MFDTVHLVLDLAAVVEIAILIAITLYLKKDTQLKSFYILTGVGILGFIRRVLDIFTVQYIWDGNVNLIDASISILLFGVLIAFSVGLWKDLTKVFKKNGT